jgi:hypothetical protein
MSLTSNNTLIAINVVVNTQVCVSILGPRGKISTETIRIVDVLNKRAKRGKELPVLGNITALQAPTSSGSQ